MARKKKTGEKLEKKTEDGRVERFYVNDGGDVCGGRFWLLPEAGKAFGTPYHLMMRRSNPRHVNVFDLKELFTTKQEAINASKRVTNGYRVDYNGKLTQIRVGTFRGQRVEVTTKGSYAFGDIFESVDEAITLSLDRVKKGLKEAQTNARAARQELADARKRATALKRAARAT